MPATPLPNLESLLPPLADSLAKTPARVLLLGATGSGKSALARRLGAALAARGVQSQCLSLDPGNPAFGLPAAANLGRWQGDGWRPIAREPLCSLDAARFRLPLVSAAQRLVAQAQLPLIIDTPGLIRGVAAAELLQALVTALHPSHSWLLSTDSVPLRHECRALNIQPVQAAAAARPPPRHQNRHRRSRRWRDYMSSAVEQTLPLSTLDLLGTPPPGGTCAFWPGAVIALGSPGGDCVMGEALALEGDTLRFRAPPLGPEPKTLLVRDARVDAKRGLTTRPPRPEPKSTPSLVHPPAGQELTQGPRVVTRDAVAELANGIFADPLLVVQLKRGGRCLLFDLGDSSRVPLRLLHRASDVFISHAHIDHIGGFMGLLRARLGAPGTCRLWGPAGLAGQVQGYLNGILWDRIGDQGPAFEVTERHGDRLHRFLLRAGTPTPRPLGTTPCNDGVLLEAAELKVRCVELDHRTPVLAYALSPTPRLHVDRDRLAAQGWPPGPWLGALKQAQQAGDMTRPIALPDGQHLSAGALSQRLLREEAVDTLVYATDLADSPANRQRLSGFARGAHTLFLEACFSEQDQPRAAQHGHLTTRACGEIAAAAGVKQLVPFHFSRRYSTDPAAHFLEIAAAFTPLVEPG
ncbi:Clp1/GlmU family protein [Motiliproteus sp. SC1-56]|uniref:Clp1/GlmU family protein n=1 Tax=Motiliproteus sp. SC1-56 TaxID=2799565 RepID=UPI001A8F8F2D|nr:Clp1/GlmU family protein [Motiliproteus sp. SC1-56]